MKIEQYGKQPAERGCIIIISMIFRIITTRHRWQELDRCSVTYYYYAASLFVLPETNFRREITNMKEQRGPHQHRTFSVFIYISDSQPVDFDTYPISQKNNKLEMGKIEKLTFYFIVKRYYWSIFFG